MKTTARITVLLLALPILALRAAADDTPKTVAAALQPFVERHVLADGVGRHGTGGCDVQSTISVPSAGICHPARSAILRAAEPRNSAGFELLICRNIFLSISRPARLSIAPRSPDIAI